MNKPETWEGTQVVTLAGMLGGQLRVAETLIGFDMTAALAMARAMGICERATAEFLPVIEAVMVRKFRERASDG